ncbi:DUF485 domain-containing protein [Porticoccus sp. GXU_MW_L64]
MSTNQSAQDIFQNPRFQKLIKRRQRVSYLLSSSVLVIYLAYNLLAAYLPDTMTLKVGESHMTSGVLATLVIIVLMVIASSIYTFWANTRFDPQKDRILKEMGIYAESPGDEQ